jgi:hypothetical protein
MKIPNLASSNHAGANGPAGIGWVTALSAAVTMAGVAGGPITP